MHYLFLTATFNSKFNVGTTTTQSFSGKVPVLNPGKRAPDIYSEGLRGTWRGLFQGFKLIKRSDMCVKNYIHIFKFTRVSASKHISKTRISPVKAKIRLNRWLGCSIRGGMGCVSWVS